MPGPDPVQVQQLVGRRISLRHRRHAPGTVQDGPVQDGPVQDGPGHTDVVGRLMAVHDGLLHVERRDGSPAHVPLADVVALREVPDRPRRARRALDVGVDDLTRITSRGWPAPESVPLGAWELRAAGAFTGRANSVAVHGDPGLPTADALAAVRGFYVDRDLTPRAQVVAGSRWEQAFLDHGWRPQEGYRGGAIVQVADLEPVQPPPDPRVVVEPTASDAWLSLYGRVDDVGAARAVLEGPATVGFAHVGDPDGPGVRAVARVVVTGEWAGLAAVETHPDHRRQGLATLLVDACVAWAVERGATRAYLQTMPDNAPALALYAPYGFVTHHEYRYLVLP